MVQQEDRPGLHLRLPVRQHLLCCPPLCRGPRLLPRLQGRGPLHPAAEQPCGQGCQAAQDLAASDSSLAPTDQPPGQRTKLCDNWAPAQEQRATFPLSVYTVHSVFFFLAFFFLLHAGCLNQLFFSLTTHRLCVVFFPSMKVLSLSCALPFFPFSHEGCILFPPTSSFYLKPAFFSWPFSFFFSPSPCRGRQGGIRVGRAPRGPRDDLFAAEDERRRECKCTDGGGGGALVTRLHGLVRVVDCVVFGLPPSLVRVSGARGHSPPAARPENFAHRVPAVACPSSLIPSLLDWFATTASLSTYPWTRTNAFEILFE